MGSVKEIIVSAILFFGLSFATQAQVVEYSLVSKGAGKTNNDVVLSKEIPIKGDREIKGTGTPNPLYVVQLARFEFMREIPDKFPAGTFLWINPDHPSEKLLLSGFYESLKQAESAARDWKKQQQFRTAFAREKPFIVQYN